MEERMDEFNFTQRAEDNFYSVVDNNYFLDEDADLIYDALNKKMVLKPFGEHLQRYIYEKAGLTEPRENISIEYYQQIIKGAFQENHTPPAFEPTTAKISALAKNWLTQQSVSRKVVFLLGFGLKMSEKDVEKFLTQALREQGYRAKDPFEVICMYCYRYGYGYLKFEQLWDMFAKTAPGQVDIQALYSEASFHQRQDFSLRVTSDASLMAFVSKLKTPDNRLITSVSARRAFDKLYLTARQLVADMYNDGEEGKKKVYTEDDITESDLEHIISSAIPIDKHGNLTPAKLSHLNTQFDGKRFNRQHISDILAGKAGVTRFDLITLNFFNYSQTLDDYPNAKARYSSFIETTNKILQDCYFGELWIANPYESFLMMCLLSDDPMGTYADVLERSYQQ